MRAFAKDQAQGNSQFLWEFEEKALKNAGHLV